MLATSEVRPGWGRVLNVNVEGHVRFWRPVAPSVVRVRDLHDHCCRAPERSCATAARWRSLRLRHQVTASVTGRQQRTHPLVNIALSAEVFVGQYLQADDQPTVVEHHLSGQVVEGGDEGFELERSHRAGATMSTENNVGTLSPSAA